MSERGIEIHSGKIVIPGSQIRQIQLGTWASPLTQTLAAQVIVSAVVNAIALGGAVYGAYFGVKGSITATADLVGAFIRAIVNTAVVLTGYVYGLQVAVDVIGTATVSGVIAGVTIEMYSEAGTTLSDPAYAIYISNYNLSTTIVNYSFIRMAENGSITLDSILQIHMGSTSDVTYFMQLSPAAKAGWGSTGAPANQSGWLKIALGVNVRYIRLYTDAP